MTQVRNHVSSGISGSHFTFGDGTINFDSKINQGYYARAIFGGSLTMGAGDSYIAAFCWAMVTGASVADCMKAGTRSATRTLLIDGAW